MHMLINANKAVNSSSYFRVHLLNHQIMFRTTCWILSMSLLLWLIFIEYGEANMFEEKFAELSRSKRYLVYTPTSAIGMFLAFAVPVEIPNRDIIFSYNFEANYNVPTNITQYDLTPPARSLALGLNRTYFYNKMEDYINSLGSPGRMCILRLICDVAKSPLNHNGLLGHVVQILFTPSTSISEGLDEEESAEQIGLDESTDCSQKYESCPLSIIDAISLLS